MKLSCTQQNLHKGLAVIARAVTTRGSLPILANVLLATNKGRLKLVTTDLEIAITTFIGSKIEQEGSITVPARLLTEFVATTSDPTITVETKDQTLHIRSAHHEVNIKGIAAEEFPLIPEVKPEYRFQVPALIFKEAIDQVVFAAAADESRPILTGVLISGAQQTVTLAATDSYRLAEKKLRLPKPVEKPFTVVVPARALQELSRITDETIDIAEVLIGENQIQATLGPTQVVSRLLEGKFPDYQQIVPQKVVTTANLAKVELVDAIKMASFFARDVANNIKLRLGRDHTLEVTAVSPQVGDAKSFLKAQTKGEQLEIAFNAKFLHDGLQALKQDKVSLELSGALSPGMIKPSNVEGYLYLVMPLKLDE